MFYPVESLKRGGRFYLCWVADSWPLRFAAITHRQLWSQDIRKLCDDLMEVITNETGRPTNRFSLRLSSQLLRGLVRLYERKVTVLLGDLCMINATVYKHTNKKYTEHEPHKRSPKRLPQLQPAAAVVPEEPENEPRVEELIRNSGNVVSNIQDITLKEAAIPDFQLPPNDNFGEENPEQALQSLLAERTVDIMRQETSAAQVSGLELPLTPGDKSHDRTRLAIDAPHMESLAEIDVTMCRKSAGDTLMPEFEKDIPEIPELRASEPIPTEPAPPQQQELELHEKEKEKSPETEAPIVPVPEVLEVEAPAPEVPVELPKAAEPFDAELEELEEQQPLAKRRRRSKLIVDKKIRLGNDFLRARIENPHVEMRFEDFTDAIVEIRVPSSTLLHSPAHWGCRLFARMAGPLLLMFQRRLEHVPTRTDRLQDQSESETEQPRQQRGTRSARSVLERISEEEEQGEQPASTSRKEQEQEPPAQEQPTDMNITAGGELLVSVDPINITTEPLAVPHVPQDENVAMQVDIADLPTQKLETLSQLAKRKSAREGEDESPPKRVRSGYMSFRESQQQRASQQPMEIFNGRDKENIPPNIQDASAEQPSARRQSQHLDHSQMASRLLQEAGLADVQQYPALEPQGEAPSQGAPPTDTQARKQSREGSDETPLGSLDRTKVSLGDSVQTTDSQRFIRKQWGIEGTMMKIMVSVKEGWAANVGSLLAHGPLIPGRRRVIAARCFSSVLQLKQHGFVRVERNPNTLEIQNITLGPRFDDM